MLNKIVSNFPRAGLLAIPGAGAALEKAIYGPLDDKLKENEHKELFREWGLCLTLVVN